MMASQSDPQARAPGVANPDCITKLEVSVQVACNKAANLANELNEVLSQGSEDESVSNPSESGFVQSPTRPPLKQFPIPFISPKVKGEATKRSLFLSPSSTPDDKYCICPQGKRKECPGFGFCDTVSLETESRCSQDKIVCGFKCSSKSEEKLALYLAGLETSSEISEMSSFDITEIVSGKCDGPKQSTPFKSGEFGMDKICDGYNEQNGSKLDESF